MRFILSFLIVLCSINLFSQSYFGSHRDLVIHNNELWLYGWSVASNDIWKSSDGFNWSEVADNLNFKAHAKGIAFKSKLFSIGGGNTNEVKTSTDGITWNTHTGNFSPRKKMASVVHNNELYVLGGSGRNDVWSTKNGEVWVQKTNNISSEFPHFWSPRAVSLNGKLILFGGHKTDWAFISNERGVYISSDDGKTWKKHQFPLPFDLSRAGNYAVYKNKLWIILDTNPNYLYTEGSPFKSEKLLLWTADGVTWHESPNRENDFVNNDDTIKGKSIAFKNKLLNFRGDGSGTSVAGFKIPDIILPIVKAQLIKQSEAQITLDYPFDYGHKIPDKKKDITFSFKSSDRTIIKTDDISITNNTLYVKPTGKTGHTKISIVADDGLEMEAHQIQFYIYPDKEKIWFSQPNNILIRLNEDINPQALKVLKFDDYDTNTYSFSASNNIFKADKIMVKPHFIVPALEIMSFNDALDTSDQSETEIMMTATDGTTRLSRKFWVKAGTNQNPEIQRILGTYNSATAKLNYQIPGDAFRDPENGPLTYIIKDLPDNLNLNPVTGTVTGTLLNSRYTLTVTAVDRYDGRISQDLIINRSNILSTDTAVSDFKNTLKIYPNPSNGIFTLTFDVLNADNATIKLYDLRGRLIENKRYKNIANRFSEELNFNELNKGLYILQIQNGNQQTSRKISIK